MSDNNLPMNESNPTDELPIASPNLHDQLLYGEYLQLANELSEQGKNPNTYRSDRWSWVTTFDWHRLCSFLAALVGSLITTAAFNKVIAGVLPISLRGSFGILLSLATATLFVWGTVKLFVVTIQTYNLGRKLKGMLKVAEGLNPQRKAIRKDALLPLAGEINRFGGWTWVGLVVMGIIAGAVDVSALYNLLSEYLLSDADASTRLATFSVSFVTLAIILGKAVYEAYFYYIPAQLYRYGQMYQEMAKTQYLINQGLLPSRVVEEREEHRQIVETLHQDLAKSKHENSDLQQQLTNQSENFEQEREQLQVKHRQELEEVVRIAHRVIVGHGGFSQLMEELRQAAGSPAPTLPQPSRLYDSTNS